MKYTCPTCGLDFFPALSRKRKFCSTRCIRYSGDKSRLSSILGKGFWQNSTYEEKIIRYKKLYEERVIKKEGCWGWRSYIDSTGSGRVGSHKYLISSYKVSWLIYKGKIAPDLLVLHKCHNRICSNPEHLYLGTNKDNTQDMLRAKRGKFNKQNSKNAKLNADKVIEIKNMLQNGISQFKIAKQFNVSRGTIQDIHRKKSWKNI